MNAHPKAPVLSVPSIVTKVLSQQLSPCIIRRMAVRLISTFVLRLQPHMLCAKVSPSVAVSGLNPACRTSAKFGLAAVLGENRKVLADQPRGIAYRINAGSIALCALSNVLSSLECDARNEVSHSANEL